MSDAETIDRLRANAIKAHRAAVHALIDCGEDFRRADVPDWIEMDRFRKLKRAGIIEQSGHENAGSVDRHLWTVPADIRRYVDRSVPDPRARTLCPDPDCPGSGFSTTADGYRCLECARPIRREHIERYYDGDPDE